MPFKRDGVRTTSAGNKIFNKRVVPQFLSHPNGCIGKALKSRFCVTAVLFFLFFTASTARSSALFTPQDSGTSEGSSIPGVKPPLHLVDSEVIRKRVVRLNPEALSNELHYETIHLNLFNNIHVTADQKERLSGANGFMVWMGAIESPSSGEVVLVVRNGTIFASVYLPSSIVQIRPVKLTSGSYSHIYVIMQLASSLEMSTARSPLCPQCGSGRQLAPESRKMIELINIERQVYGIPPLEYSTRLERAAIQHSTDMAVHNICSHQLSNGQPFYMNVFNCGYPMCSVAENVAAGLSSAVDAFESMFSSPEHRPNLMNPDFTQIGVSEMVNANSTNRFFWTLEFGAPSSTQVVRFNAYCLPPNP